MTSEVLEAGDPSEEDSSCKETGNPIIKSLMVFQDKRTDIDQAVVLYQRVSYISPPCV